MFLPRLLAALSSLIFLAFRLLKTVRFLRFIAQLWDPQPPIWCDHTDVTLVYWRCGRAASVLKRQELGRYTPPPLPLPDVTQSAHCLTIATFIIPHLLKGFKLPSRTISKAPNYPPHPSAGDPQEIGDHVTGLNFSAAFSFHRTNSQIKT